MKLNKSFFIVLIVGALFFAFGCDSGDVTDNDGGAPFIGGVVGVNMEFGRLTPVSEFDQGEDIPVKVILSNKGEYDLVEGNAKVKLYGLKLADFGLSEGYKAITGKLSGIGEFSDEGGKQEIDFGKMNYNQPILNSQEFDMWAKSCYAYQTRGLIDVCMKSKLSEEANDESICSLDGEKVKSGYVSTGPVQLTSVKQDTRGSDQVRFDLVIENKGDGRVYINDVSCEDLDDEMKRVESKDKIAIEIIRPLNTECRFQTGEDGNKGIINLDNGVGDVICWVDVEDTYKEKLSVVLSYMYTDTITKTITIYEKV